MFKMNNAKKTGKFDINRHNAMRIPDGIFQTHKKLFLSVNPNKICKLESAGHLWLQYNDRP